MKPAPSSGLTVQANYNKARSPTRSNYSLDTAGMNEPIILGRPGVPGSPPRPQPSPGPEAACSPALRALRLSLRLPSFLVKAFNKDFIFPPTLAAVRSLYNLLDWEEGKSGPAPGRQNSLDPGSGGGVWPRPASEHSWAQRAGDGAHPILVCQLGAKGA